MKKLLSFKYNLLILILVVFLLIKQGPAIINNFKNEGIIIPPRNYNSIGQNQKILFPIPHNSVIIFWASWCGPCKIEMHRFKSSVEEGKINASSIFAVNAFESAIVVKDFLSKNSYPFIFLEAPKLSTILKIQVTPTVVFIENNKVISSSSGMSLSGIWKAESFLK